MPDHSDPAHSKTGRVERLWLKRARLLPMDEVAQAEARAGQGLARNANQGGKRQVTLLSAEAWQEVEAKLGHPASPVLRRANVLLSGIDLEQKRGRILRIGEAQVRVWGETVPCRSMEEAMSGLQEALRPHWRGGAFGEIALSGIIRVGDPVEWVDPLLPLSS